ncbi:PAS domain S-box-containing protein [Bacillus mesophilus]|uniref:histidine kinase n=1 Tax=Bacillus mesophilus TaxID=1808955 RepID=A0A6M0QDH4_9BACI|nr:ATP-binding protein [Bacillus mesophilus]MBM7663050.1 PAS domain S-box-containing protein [Bacillus mesophilus]NEY73630.1 PAS domain-containing protein [Bacillus mesophilus]
MKINKKNIPIIYILIGIIWISSTGFALKNLDLSVESIFLLENFKGLFFVLVTALLLSKLIKKEKDVREITEEKEKLQMLIDCMPDAVVFKDGEGKWQQVNKYLLELFEIEDVDWKGKTDVEIAKHADFYHDALLYCVDSDEETWKAGSITRCLEFVPMKNGKFKTFDTIKIPSYFPDGTRKSLVVIGRDITDLKNAEEMLRQSEKLSVVGELAAGIAHEIRNPLTSIKGFLQLSNEGTINLSEYDDFLLGEIDRISEIVTELLLLAKPQKTDFEVCNLNSIVEEVATLMKSEALYKDVEINVHLSKSPFIMGHFSQLKQVFINILKNGMDAIGTKGIINISLIQENEEFVVVSFEDTGCGISKERLKRIGEPFYSVKEKGIGLGMTVSFRIVEAHKGKINIQSEVNKGTTVAVMLPIEKHIT